MTIKTLTQENEDLRIGKHYYESHADDKVKNMQGKQFGAEASQRSTETDLETEKAAHIQTRFYKRLFAAAFFTSLIYFFIRK